MFLSVSHALDLPAQSTAGYHTEARNVAQVASGSHDTGGTLPDSKACPHPCLRAVTGTPSSVPTAGQHDVLGPTVSCSLKRLLSQQCQF